MTNSNFAGEQSKKAIASLALDFKDALEQQKTSFHCGAYTGPSGVASLFSQMRTTLEITTETPSQFFRPSLKYENSKKNSYILRVPKIKLEVHQDVMLASYLLRAHADFSLGSLEIEWSDLETKNSICRDFSDSIQFGNFRNFLTQLSYFGSIGKAHAADIPTSLLLGYISKQKEYHSKTSLTSLYGISKIYENNHKEYCLMINKAIGNARPYYEEMYIAHQLNLHDITKPARQHTLITTSNGKQVVIITAPVWFENIEFPNASIIRTVLWCNNPQRGGFKHSIDHFDKLMTIH